MASSDKMLTNGTHKPPQTDQPFSDPVYKQISLTNGHVNRMTKDEIKDKLRELHLDTRGVKEVLSKRLKNFYKKQKLSPASRRVGKAMNSDLFYDFLLVIDFEATCEENNTNYLHEIIEFPVVLIETLQLEIVDVFHAYCKPQLNPKLSNFCTELTGITQEQVDAAERFPDVMRKLTEWMDRHELSGKKHKIAIVTDGPWDMSRFMYSQCRHCSLAFPKWGKKWINLRKNYANFYGVRRLNLNGMLANLGMEFEGRPHKGVDDARNIARIAIRLLKDGAELRVNEGIFPRKVRELRRATNALPEIVPVSRAAAEESSESSTESSNESPPAAKTSSKKGSGSDPCTGIKDGLNKLSIEQHRPNDVIEDGVDDLLSYFQLQKNS